MTMTANVARIFEDARLMHNAALTLMNTGDIRDAAEKAWCATKRAADGMITARTGEEPPTSAGTSMKLRDLANTDADVQALRQTYRERLGTLHGDCFYYGICQPIDYIIQLIRESDDFIKEAEQLADA
ncbi:MAG: hypothetical protein OXC99_07650 [Chloroflexi bacterium]|nr:hypothetical protein [Chloroflexota bacterium]